MSGQDASACERKELNQARVRGVLALGPLVLELLLP
jgi:hypothetical protein